MIHNFNLFIFYYFMNFCIMFYITYIILNNFFCEENLCKLYSKVFSDDDAYKKNVDVIH